MFWYENAAGVWPVGGKEEWGGVERTCAGRRSLTFAGGGEARLLGALDLRDAAVVHSELHDTVAQALDFFADERDPF